MSPARWQQINAVLDTVLALPPDDRDSYLATHHSDDEALRAKVLDLAAAYEDAESFLERPVAEYAAPLVEQHEPEDGPGHQERVGPYRLLSRIARGGMGTVYLAARADEHFEKKVAVKLIRRGMDTDDVLRRFVGERQILARLEHPHIARLLDGGVTDDDRPYFVMEYVAGQPIDRYCNRERLPIRERLHLFLSVCEAVQYAHQNLVVHRDLKPSNILVTQTGRVKLLDFGIAKLLSDEHEKGLTRTGVRVMTPEYAAPEQVRGAPITTATDVYALGILLYKLLTGRLPYRVQGATPNEIERAILDAEPTRPSTAITTTQEAATTTPESISRDRRTSVSSLRRHLSGDLDTIVLKALKKEPARRYASVQTFTDDVRRYLNGLPVHARPDTLTYRATKFVRRHRFGVAAAVLFLVMLGSYAITTRTQAQRIAVERDKAEQVALFLADVLNRADPYETADNMTVRQVLDRAAERVETDLVDQPEVEAPLRHIMSDVYTNLGQYEAALPHAEKALALRKSLFGERHPDVAASLNDLAEVTCFLGDYDQSDSLYRAALDMRRDLFGENSEPYAESLTEWGLLLYYKGERQQSLHHLRQALTLNRQVHGPQHPRVAESLHTLGGMYWAGSFSDSTRAAAYRDTTELLVRQALDMRQTLFEADHPDVVHSMSFLAEILRFKGRLEEAEPLFEEALALHRQRLGKTHPYIATRLLGLARLRQDQQRYAEADTLATQAVLLRRTRLGDDHPETRQAENELETMRQNRLQAVTLTG